MSLNSRWIKGTTDRSERSPIKERPRRREITTEDVQHTDDKVSLP